MTRPQSLANSEQNKTIQTPAADAEAQKSPKVQDVKTTAQQTPTKVGNEQKTPPTNETLPANQPVSVAVKPTEQATPEPLAPIKASSTPTSIKSDPKILPSPASIPPKPVVPVVAATPIPVVSKPVDVAAVEKQEVSTSVWLSGFPNTIKAAELKAFCLSAGKVTDRSSLRTRVVRALPLICTSSFQVMAAKVVANAKLQTYYGLVTMATVDDANMCLKLNNTMYNNKFKITCEMVGLLLACHLFVCEGGCTRNDKYLYQFWIYGVLKRHTCPNVAQR